MTLTVGTASASVQAFSCWPAVTRLTRPAATMIAAAPAATSPAGLSHRWGRGA